ESDLPSGSTGWADSIVSRGLLGAFVGLLIGLGLAFGADRLSPRLRTRRDAQAAFAAPVLAEIPRLSADEQRSNTVTAQSRPRSRAAEAFRAARSRILAPASVHGAEPNDESEQRGLV